MLPYVSLKKRSKLPKTPGVYYAIHPLNPTKILYCGMSANMRNRWLGDRHHQLEALLDRGHINLHYRVLRSEAAAERREAHDIQRFDPLLNGRKETTPFNLLAEIEDKLQDAIRIFLIGAIVASIGYIFLHLL
jgi:excinuclease UvrABC nuclease subunit